MEIESFLQSLETQSTETLRAYGQDLRRYEEFLRMKGLRINQVKPRHVEEFLTYLSAHHGRTNGDGGYAAATIARRLAAISAYHEWVCNNSDVRIPNPVERVKRPKVRNAIPRSVNDSTIAELIDGITSLRDKAIVLLFLYSGLRLSELAQLNKDSITAVRRTLPNGQSEICGSGEVVGKGNKRRVFLVGLQALQAIGRYLKDCREQQDDNPALFLSSRKTRLSCRAIEQIVSKWCERLGIEHIHVHQFRHSFATRNVNAGMSAAVLQSLLGHANLNTTERYFHIEKERLTREYFAAMEYVHQTSPV